MAEDSLLRSSPEVAEVNRSGWKLIAATVVPPIFGIAASYLFLSGHILWSVVAAVLFVNLIAIQAMLLKSSEQTWLSLALCAIGLLVPFYAVNINVLGTAFIVILLFFAMGIFSGRHELNNSLKIDFSKITRKMMSGVMVGMVGGVTVFAVAGALGPTIFSTANIAKYVIEPYVVAPAMQDILHQPYTPNETVEQFVVAEIEQAPQLQSLPNGALKNEVIASSASSSIAQLESTLGGSIEPDQSLSFNLIQITENKVSNMQQPDQSAVIIILYLALWSVVALIANVVSFVLVITAFLLFELLIVTNFAEIQLESRSHEVISI